jgi:hypothetical protein
MKRPLIKTVAAILVLVFVLFSAVWPLAGVDELLGINNGYRPGGGMPVGSQGIIPEGTPPSFDGTPQPGLGGGPGGGMQPNTGNGMRQSGMMPAMSILQYVLYAVIIVCGLIAFGGFWLNKRWGSVMAIITAVIVLVMTITAMFGVLPTALLIENIIRLLLGIAVIILAVLPGKRIPETNELT